MNTFRAYIAIIRPVNALLAGTGVFLGFWLTNVQAPISHCVLLILATVCALGYGNVINDIKDKDGDRINHPDRPLTQGTITQVHAIYYAAFLAIISLTCSFFVSTTHAIGTVIPLLALTLYTLFFKGTPLLGNTLISLLVSYTMIFGGIGSPQSTRIFIPGFLAFLLNLVREIVKDIQDKKGDVGTGVTTTAALPRNVLKIIIAIPALLYVPASFLPYALGHFHLVYLYICAIILLPLHLFWFSIFMGDHKEPKLGTISMSIKIEMLGGLAALALDTLISIK